MPSTSTFTSPLTFLGSRGRLARYLGRPLAAFLDIEAAGGILLLAAAVAALLWANLWPDAYSDFWHTEVVIEIGGYRVHGGELDLHDVVNDALMTLFFFVVGLEIKRELVVGDLRSPRVAALPAVAALGGMIVPALIYLAFNTAAPERDGWGIPMATDIAFAVGVLTLLGPRIPAQLKVFLLTLAIVDDIGAILVIAVVYTSDLSMGWLGVGLVTLGAIVVMQRVRVWYLPAYWLAGIAAWLAFLESGVHATIAGVICGLITPARPLMGELEAEAVVDTLETKRDITAADVREASFYIQESVSVAERLQFALHPWTSFVVIPLFALANAGIPLSSGAVRDAASSPVTLGILFGLVVGKAVGVAGFSLAAVRIGWLSLPRRVSQAHMFGAALLAGIGFTVSLFIGELAFASDELVDQAKMGILAASAMAAVLGATVLHLASRKSQPVPEEVDDLEREEPRVAPVI